MKIGHDLNIYPNLLFLFYDIGWPNPECVSINNGIYICHNCASIHQSVYHLEISYIKALFEEPTCTFSFIQLRVMINGGNSRAAKFY